MIVETKFGKFELLKNERDAFSLEMFEKKYLPEYFDKYVYLVGDLADDILRLKGFALDSKPTPTTDPACWTEGECEDEWPVHLAKW